jgi:large subunit ribosomal protein L25
MKNVALTVQVRNDIGKGVARKLRASGKVPAVLYGQGMKPLALFADEKILVDLISSISTENTLIDLMVEGYRKKPLKALIREVQRHHYKSKILHVDFYQVSLQKKIHVEVPISLLGTPEGVKNFGGVLERHMREVTILCLPTDIPEKVELDVSGLGLNDSVRVEDIILQNAEILDDRSQPIATVIPPTVMKEAEEAEEAAEEAEEEPEVVGKEKKEKAEEEAGADKSEAEN